MDKEDGRRLSRQAQYERRKQAVRLHKKGMPINDIAAALSMGLILDNLRVHHSKLVKAWLAERQDRIEVFYLPSYSPELNPDERLNVDLKHAMGSRVQVRTKDKLKVATENHMTMLAADPDRVMSYFQDSKVKYAA